MRVIEHRRVSSEGPNGLGEFHSERFGRVASPDAALQLVAEEENELEAIRTMGPVQVDLFTAVQQDC